MSQGKLLVLEGLDGSGKSTQFELLCKELSKQGVAHRAISFPDYNEPSSVLVQQYLAGEYGTEADSVNAYAASSFYAVDRFASFKKHWQEDFERGIMIVAARYTTSNAIYQMVKLPESQWSDYLDWLADFEYEKMGLPKPDSVLFLDMPVAVSRQLLKHRYKGDDSRLDLHEKNLSFLDRCRHAALYAADRLDWKIVSCAHVDANAPLPIETVHNHLIALVKEALF